MINGITNPHQRPFSDKFFILERFILKQRIQIMKTLEHKDDNDIISLCISLLSQNLFLKKFRLDPGYRLKVLLELDKDSKILRQAKRELILLFEDSSFIQEFSETVKKSKREDFEFDEKRLLMNIINERQYIKVFTSAFLKENKKIFWFYLLWREFMEKGRISEAIAAEAMLLELIGGYFQGYFLFWNESPYEKERNAHYYLLSAIRELVKKINPFFLDYIESQRGNTRLSEEIQDIVDSLKYNNLTDQFDEISDHLKDIYEKNIDIFNNKQLYKSILTICALIHFNNLPLEQKILELNKIQGVSKFIELVQKYPMIYPDKMLTVDLPAWFRNGVLPSFKTLIEEKIKSLEHIRSISYLEKDEEGLTHFILVKYLCKILILKKQYSEAFKLLVDRFEFIERLVDTKFKNLELCNGEDHFQVEMLFLLGQIAGFSGKSAVINQIIKSFNRMELSETDSLLALKFPALKSILYRISGEYKKESIFIRGVDIERKKLLKEPKLNPLEIIEYLFPAQLFFSEEFNPKAIEQQSYIQQSVLTFERESLIPHNIEPYIVYLDTRKIFLNNIPYSEALEIRDKSFELSHLNFMSLQLQCMGSFKEALIYAPDIVSLINFYDKNDDKRILMETIAFPYLYLGDYKNAKIFLEKALEFNPTDAYYNEYLILVNLALEDVSEARKHLFKQYYLEKVGKTTEITIYIESSYRLLLFWLQESKFDDVINSLLDYPPESDNLIPYVDKIYCDIGTTLANLGFFEKALYYYLKSYKFTKDAEFQAKLLNNIGTLHSDQRNIEKAIETFQNALRLNSDDKMIWLNLAKMHQLKLNHIEAKDIYKKASKYFKKKDKKFSEFMTLQSELAKLDSKGIINLNLVGDNDALDHLKVARELFLNRNTIKFLSDNTGSIIHHLTNGFDCLFHSTISLWLDKILRKTYPNQTWPPPNIKKDLPRGVREVWRGKHMTFGNISHLINDVLAANPNNIVKTFRDEIFRYLNSEDLRNIKKMADISADIRNPASHGGIIDNQTLMNVLPNLIGNLNKCILILNKFGK